MPIDDRALDELVEQSQDIHSDAMRATNESLDELVEVGLEQRARGDIDPDESRLSAIAHEAGIRKGLAGGGALAATAFGATLLGLATSSAFAATPTDIQMLQTSASIENLAVSTYKTALTLPYIGGASANGVIKAFARPPWPSTPSTDRHSTPPPKLSAGRPKPIRTPSTCPW
jgi:hypothetical protein